MGPSDDYCYYVCIAKIKQESVVALSKNKTEKKHFGTLDCSRLTSASQSNAPKKYTGGTLVGLTAGVVVSADRCNDFLLGLI